jgi:hypothetical protein
VKPTVVESGSSTGAVEGISNGGADYSAGEDIIYNLAVFGDRCKTDKSSPRGAAEISDEKAHTLLENRGEIEDIEYFYVIEVSEDESKDEKTRKSSRKNKRSI